jgi:uncharacterized protein YdiU (UPF0061 family)
VLDELMRSKLGLDTVQEEDDALVEALLLAMHAHRTDYTVFFRRLADFVPGEDNAPLRDLFWTAACLMTGPYAMRRVCNRNQTQPLRRAAMLAVNPKYILRNYLAEQAIQAAQQGDFSLIARLHDCLQRPFDEQNSMRILPQNHRLGRWKSASAAPAEPATHF